MTLDEIIQLFEGVEKGVEGQIIGYHLHQPISQAVKQVWLMNANYPASFSGFLKALKDEPTP